MTTNLSRTKSEILQRQCVTIVAKLKETENICTRQNKVVCIAVNNVPDMQNFQVSDIR